MKFTGMIVLPNGMELSKEYNTFQEALDALKALNEKSPTAEAAFTIVVENK